MSLQSPSGDGDPVDLLGVIPFSALGLKPFVLGDYECLYSHRLVTATLSIYLA